LCKDPHDLEGEIRDLAYKKKKLLFRDGNKLNVGDRHSSRAPWLAVNQCHFTKNIVSRKIGHRSVANLNAHVTALDNEKLVSLLAFAENDTAPALILRVSISLPVKTLKLVSAVITIGIRTGPPAFTAATRQCDSTGAPMTT
jgi:hypothetical protein